MTRLSKEFDPIGFSNCFIAGGAVLSAVTKTPINDYDIYPKSKEGFESVLNTLIDESSGQIINISDRAITYKSNCLHNDKGERMIIQIMYFDWFENAQKIFNSFDFTVCMGAYDCDSSEYFFHPDFYPDIASKTLRFNANTRYPLNSLIRTVKYKNKGFHIGKFENVKIALAVAKAGLPNSWEELELAIGGTYGTQLKLNRDDIEYSFENAIELLSNTELDAHTLTDNEEKFEKITCNQIINCFDDNNRDYADLNDRINFFINGFFVGDSFSTHMFNARQKLLNFNLKKPTKLFGYSTPMDISSSKSCGVGSVYSPKYGISMKIYKDKSTMGKNTNNVLLVSTDPSDITNVDGIYFHTKKVKVESMVDNTTANEQDVFSVLDKLLCA